jgi:signal-transduction protein with cAMP-binding, CBS, and nucleotidyltransferase domain
MMDTPISSMMNSPVWSVGMDDTVQTIQALMSQHDLSWVPVVEPSGMPVGVIALSDLMQFHSRDGDPAVVSAWQVCHYKPISVTADTSVAEVARLMLAHKIHHVVVTKDDTMVGVVSTLDFVRRFVLDIE